MPLYEFTCEQQHKSEQIVRYGTRKARCPECGGKAIRKGVEVPARRNPQHGIQK